MPLSGENEVKIVRAAVERKAPFYIAPTKEKITFVVVAKAAGDR